MILFTDIFDPLPVTDFKKSFRMVNLLVISSQTIFAVAVYAQHGLLSHSIHIFHRSVACENVTLLLII